MTRTRAQSPRGKASGRGNPQARRPATAEGRHAAVVAAADERYFKDCVRARVDRANAVIGSLIRTLREERGLSKAEVARRAGISPKTVRAIEEGSVSRGALLEHVSKIAGAMDCELVLAMVRPGRTGAVTEVLRQNADSEDSFVQGYAVV